MIVLIPISQYRVTYELGSGRPYSHFERMLLQAIRDGATILDDLKSVFLVHPRLIIEGLVTLTHAGWIAVGGSKDKGFVLTPEGKQAAQSGSPPMTTQIRSGRAYLLMERVTGAIFSRDEVRFVTKRDLGSSWDQCGRIRPDVTYNNLDEGQVQHLLRRRQGEWIRWVGPIDMVSKESNWIPVNVNLNEGSIVGLPDLLQSRLAPTILEEATRFARTLPEGAMDQTWQVTQPRKQAKSDDDEENASANKILAAPKHQVPAKKDDLLFTSAQHRDFLNHLLLSAKKSVLVSSEKIDINSLNEYKSIFIDTLQRGVNVDVLWGAAKDSEANRHVREFFRSVAFDAKNARHPGTIRANMEPSASRANVVIADINECYTACVGSYAWLSASTDSTQFASIKLNQLGLVSALARCLVGIWSAVESEVLAAPIDRWRRVAGDLEMKLGGNVQSENSALSLLLDNEHDIMSFISDSIECKTTMIGSDLGPGCEARLRELLANSGMAVTVVYSEDSQGRIQALQDAFGHSVQFLQLPNLSANLLIHRSSVLVTSFDFLGATPTPPSMQRRHIGILIEDPQIASFVEERFSKA